MLRVRRGETEGFGMGAEGLGHALKPASQRGKHGGKQCLVKKSNGKVCGASLSRYNLNPKQACQPCVSWHNLHGKKLQLASG